MRPVLLAVILCACGPEEPAAAVDATPPGPPDATPWIPPDAPPTPSCANDLDDDGDDRIDFPYEPGCEGPEDDDETDPVPLPQCSDGVDNDGYHGIDYPMDLGCTSAGDPGEDAIPPGGGGCGPAVPVEKIAVPSTVSGTIAAGPNDVAGTCGGAGNEAAYRFTLLEQTASLTITAVSAATVADVVLYVREDCADPESELACTDDPETLVLTDVAPGSYSLIVDSFGPGSLGAYELTITPD